MPAGGFSQNVTLTGEEVTITISDSTVITVNGVTATISDLKVDDVVTVSMDGDTVVSITVGMGGKFDGGAPTDAVAPSTDSTKATDATTTDTTTDTTTTDTTSN